MLCGGGVGEPEVSRAEELSWSETEFSAVGA